MDVCTERQVWFTGDQLDLEKVLANGHLTHVPKQNVILSHQNIDEVRSGFIFTDNIVDRKIKIKTNANTQNYTEMLVVKFDKHSETHSLRDEQGNAWRFDLNQLHREGRIEIPGGLVELVGHLVCLNSGNRSRRPAARSMPKGKTDPQKID